MLDAIIRPLVEHRKRGWIVITATFAVGVVFTWPAVDYYFAAAEHRHGLVAELEQGLVTGERLELYRQQLERQTERLRSLEDAELPPERVEQFRDQITEWVKESGCQLRRARLGDMQLRAWHDGDHPLQTRSTNDKDKTTPFQLRQQPLSLLVTGPIDRISELLARFGEHERLVHTTSLHVRRNTDDPRTVEMDLELTLYDLVHGTKSE